MDGVPYQPDSFVLERRHQEICYRECGAPNYNIKELSLFHQLPTYDRVSITKHDSVLRSDVTDLYRPVNGIFHARYAQEHICYQAISINNIDYLNVSRYRKCQQPSKLNFRGMTRKKQVAFRERKPPPRLVSGT